MLRIRLRRVGKKKQPMYRLVVTDARAPRDGAFVEIIGRYNPLTEPATLEIDKEKALSWISRGAQPSEAAAKLLARQGIIEKTEKALKAEKAVKVTKAEMVTKAEKATKAEAVEKAEMATTAAKAEKAEKTEKAEEAEEAETVETVETVETAENAPS